jgi:geranylgeranyl diphosphate synthase type II
MSTNFLTTLQNYKDLVWPEIETILNSFTDFPAYCRLSSKYQDIVNLHRNLVSDYPHRKGKYLRPSLLLLTAQSMGFPLDKALKTAAAMQLSEEWILCHDDIEDDSQERRGAPALHRIYGKELAINAGDSLHILQWHLLFENFQILDFELATKIYQEFYVMLNRTALGQTVDIKWNQDSQIILTDEDVFLTLESKTGYYTIAGPMRLGALLAGATSTQLDKIYQFGILLGRAFQITDDILDLTSDFAGLKKQQGNDIYENKKTIMLVHLIRQVQGDDKVKLGLILSKSRDQKTPQDVSYVIGLMEKYDSFEYARNMAKDFAAQSLTIFDRDLDFLSHQPYRDQLKEGISFIINRDH